MAFSSRKNVPLESFQAALVTTVPRLQIGMCHPEQGQVRAFETRAMERLLAKTRQRRDAFGPCENNFWKIATKGQ